MEYPFLRNSQTDSEKADELRDATSRLNLPPRFKRATLDNFDKEMQLTAFEFAKNFSDRYAKDTRVGLYLYGMPGSGKTHLSTAIANKLLLKAFPKFVTSPELLMQIKKTFGKANSDHEYIDELSYAKLLILDDIGSEKPTEWVQETLFVIIDRRYTHHLPTIFTSNFSLDQLKERLGYRIASRIAEMTEVVELRSSDYRLRKLK